MRNGAKCQTARPAEERILPKSAYCRRAHTAEERILPNRARTAELSNCALSTRRSRVVWQVALSGRSRCLAGRAVWQVALSGTGAVGQVAPFAVRL